MYVQKEKLHDNKSAAMAHLVSRKTIFAKGDFGFVDNRIGSNAQKTLQKVIDTHDQADSGDASFIATQYRKSEAHKPTDTMLGQPVIQRAIGYEFETGWNVWDCTNIEIWKKNFKPGPPPLPKSLSKKDLIYEGYGFKVNDKVTVSNITLSFFCKLKVKTFLAGFVIGN
jgi:hypothetical protein